MAEKIAALNLGSQNASLGLFEVKKNVLHLNKCMLDGVVADPSQEAIRNSQVEQLLGRLVEDLKMKSESVLYSVPGQSVFTRFMKLPALADDNVDQIVAFEAQQHIPFPINEVAWDWAMVDETSAEREVLIVAIKTSTINEIDQMVNSSGMISKSVESAQIALVNSFYYSYPEVVDSATPVLILDCGAKSTNLIFVQGRKLFIRSVGVSGVSVTNAITNEYNIDFDKAEQYKVSAGRVAINSAYLEEWDEQTGNLAQVVTSSVSRLPAEMTRTINYWRSHEGGSPPVKIYLAGAATNLPYFKEYMEERMETPIEYFNALKNIVLGPNIDEAAVSNNAHQLGEIVGLALKGAGATKIEIDLVPESISERREASKKKPFFAAAAAIAITGPLLWAGMQFVGNKSVQAKLAGLNNEVSQLSSFETGISSATRKRKDLDITSDQLSGVIEAEYRVVNLLDDLTTNLASESVWLKSIDELVDYDFKDLSEADSFAYIDKSITSISYGDFGLKRFSEKELNAPTAPTINAVMIRGYWRANPVNQQVVYELLEKIKSAPDSMFTMEVNGKELEDDELLIIDSVIPSDDFKAEFTMVLPLKDPVKIK